MSADSLQGTATHRTGSFPGIGDVMSWSTSARVGASEAYAELRWRALGAIRRLPWRYIMVQALGICLSLALVFAVMRITA